MRITDIFQMYTGWGINGLADVYHNDNFICSSTGIVMEKLPDKKEAKLFAEKVEDALDAIVTGKEWNMEEELEDSLWGRTGTQLAKAGNVFRKKEEDGFREKERVKGLISDISHQTRTPIANIKLYLELLEDEEFSQNGQEFLGKIKGQMEKIEFLMQNMIKMSRLETGILQIHKEDQIYTKQSAMQLPMWFRRRR